MDLQRQWPSQILTGLDLYQIKRLQKGYCTMVGGILVSWKSKKLVVGAKCYAKAEYRAVSRGRCEILWLRLLLMSYDSGKVVQRFFTLMYIGD